LIEGSEEWHNLTGDSEYLEGLKSTVLKKGNLITFDEKGGIVGGVRPLVEGKIQRVRTLKR